MASAAELAIYDVCHDYFVGASAHFEPYFGMTYIAFEADAMKPMRKDYRAHAFFFRSVVENNISIFGIGAKRDKQREQYQNKQG
jgi:hypothetical protein